MIGWIRMEVSKQPPQQKTEVSNVSSVPNPPTVLPASSVLANASTVERCSSETLSLQLPPALSSAALAGHPSLPFIPSNSFPQTPPPKPRVVLLVPASEFTHSLFLHAFAECISAFKELDVDWSYFISTEKPLDKCRQTIWDMALKGDYDYALWLDNDMLINRVQVKELITFLQKRDFTACTGLYFKRGNDFSPLIYSAKENEKGETEFYNAPMPVSLNPILISGAGMGCMAVNLKRFKSLVEDYIRIGGEVPSPLFRFDRISEDLNFCAFLREIDGTLVVLPWVEVQHYGAIAEGWMFEADKNRKIVKKEGDAYRV